MGIPAFDKYPGQQTDVCLIVEGCYPHILGGVSSWLDWLMRSLPELTFSVVSLVSGQGARLSRYTFPDNLLRFAELDLQGPPNVPWSRPFRPRHGDVEHLVRTLVDFIRFGRIEALGSLLAWLNANGSQLRFHDLTQSEFSWEVVCGMYEELMPHASFVDFFWAWRSLVGGLLATAVSPLPPARIYHTISTGYAGLLAARASLETGAPTLITEHGIYTNERRIEILMADWIVDTVDKGLSLHDRRMDLRDLWITAFESYARACYSASDCITTLYGDNQSLQRQLGADPTKLVVIPNGIDLQRFAGVVPATPEAPPTMALIGRVVPIKDVKTYIAAAAIVRRSIPGLRALVLGPLDEDPVYVAECRRLVAQLGIQDTVRFEGRVDVVQWLPSIHAVVLTSLSEAQPLTILEAGAAGIPCVTTNVGSCREILFGRLDEAQAYGIGGIITDLVAPQQTAEALIELLGDPELRSEMGGRLRERVWDLYSSERSAAAYRRLYTEHARAKELLAWPG
ncbi:MAG: GT4 family glycosyltransferase PelF [Mesorhizobium sp.]|nr:GT4 family glycosyltransferase PelF [Mesorhizobium sp.]